MTTLHIREQGSVVRRDAERIEVTVTEKPTRRKKVLLSEPIHTIEQVNLYGNVQVTTQAMALLFEHDIETIFLSLYGRYRGHALVNGSRIARLRHQQLRVSGDEDASLVVAKQIVLAKIHAQRQLLEELSEQSSGGLPALLSQAARGIEQMQRELSRAATLDELRGFEGKSAAHYFGVLRHLLDPSWKFNGRAYYPPPDPFNALLSFGYSLLQKDLTATVQQVGLDPYLGCLHAIEYGRPSLVLDLMEEFRPLIADRAALDLVLSSKLKPTDFTFTNRAERPVEIGEKLLSLVITAYETRCDDLILHRPSNSQNRLRRCFELQTRLYARVVSGEQAQFDGVTG
ncbi:MAG: CRISPR-associated endonuclease Cas1 [Caldilineaceae bacterium]